jgi:hypothetical protein
VHFEDLVKVPKTWKDLTSHPMRKQFEQAAQTEIRNLVNRGTWRKMQRAHAKTKPIPLKWVFAY